MSRGVLFGRNEVQDNVGVDQVTLYYRETGASGYSSASMTRSQGTSRYSGTIDAANVTAAGLEYYLQAADAVPNTTTHPTDGVTAPHPVAVIALEADFSDDGYVDYLDLFQFAPRWHTGPNSPNWDALFDLCPGADPDLGQPEEHLDFCDLNVFSGQWHLGVPPASTRAVPRQVREQLEFALDLDANTPGIQNVLPLEPGRTVDAVVVATGPGNLRGFHVALSYDSRLLEVVSQGGKLALAGECLTQADGGVPLFFADASTEGLSLSGAVLGGQGAANGQGILAKVRFKVSPQETPGRAAAQIGVRLGLTEVTVTDDRGALSTAQRVCEGVLLGQAVRTTAAEWRARLAARVGEQADAHNYFGVSAKGVQALTDLNEPTGSIEEVSLAFVRDEAGAPRRSVDLQRPSAGSLTWNVALRAPGGRQTVTVSWPDLGEALPSGFTATLTDPVTGSRTYLRTQQRYSFTTSQQPAAETRMLVLEVSPRDPRGLPLLSQVATTSSRGGGVVLSFQLSAEASLQALIVAPTGRTVRTLSSGRPLRSGRSELAWDLRDQRNRPVPRGVYLVRLVARSPAGQQMTAVRPVSVR